MLTIFDVHFSPKLSEAIELNLTRAIKTAGLKSSDIAAALVAQKALAALNVDPRVLAQVMNNKIYNLEKSYHEIFHAFRFSMWKE